MIWKNLDLFGKIIVIGLITALLLAFMFGFSSCVGARNGCPATRGISGYHGR